LKRIICNDFEQFVEGLPRLEGRYILRTPQSRDWRLRLLDLNGVTLMAGREGAGRIYTGSARDSFHAFVLLSGDESMTLDGARVGRHEVVWCAPGSVFHGVTDRPIRWLNLAVSVDLVSEWARAHEDEFDRTLLGPRLKRQAPRFAAPLIGLVHRLFQIDAQSPELLRTPAAERAARNEVLDHLFRALRPSDAGGRRTHGTCANRLSVLDKAVDLVASLQDHALHIEDFCAAVGASERTLRNVFRECLGISPHHYVMAHRLHAIRSAIRGSRPEDTVTSICARFGVWDFGRLAKQYKTQFGELPSQSLQACRRLPALREPSALYVARSDARASR
jgi:AraC family ethanolamine operon transcriptional activator